MVALKCLDATALEIERALQSLADVVLVPIGSADLVIGLSAGDGTQHELVVQPLSGRRFGAAMETTEVAVARDLPRDEQRRA